MTRGDKGRVIFSAEEDDRIKKLISKRITLYNLKRAMGCSEKVMVKALKRLGLKTIAKDSYSPEEEHIIVDFLTRGFSVEQVVKETGASERKIQYIARENKVKGWGRTGQFSEELKDKLVQGYKETGNYHTFADSLGLTHPEAKCILDERGIRVILYKPDAQIDEQVRHLMKTSSDSYIDMAKKIGIGFCAFRSICRRLGIKRDIPLRPPAPAQSGPMIDTMIAKYGEEEGRKRYAAYTAKMSKSYSGKGNPMYGKPSPQGAGVGWKGWYKDHYCRSLREIIFLVNMDNENIKWTPGEKISIRYQVEGKERTYRPDFIIGNRMIEIKPIRLQKSPSVQTKAEAAKRYCEAHGMVYELIDVAIDAEPIMEKLDSGDLKFDRDYETRFREYVAKQWEKTTPPSLSAQSAS